MTSRAEESVWRVIFAGTELGEIATVGLAAAGVVWEGSEAGLQQPWRHRVRLAAADGLAAVAAVRTALAAHIAVGVFVDFEASVVRDSRGEPWRGPVDPKWREIDWQADPRRARLSAVQRALIGCLLDDGEPTWIVATEPDVPSDRAAVELALEELQGMGLVRSVLAEAFEPGADDRLDRWWAATDLCWDVLGLIKSPRYAWWMRGKL